MQSTKIRLSIALSLVAVLSLSGCGLIGDGSRVTDEEMDTLFLSRPSVADVSTSCVQNLPFAFSCDVDIQLSSEVTTNDLADLVTLIDSTSIDAKVTVSATSADQIHQEITLGDRNNTGGIPDPDAVAATFLAVVGFDGVGDVTFQPASDYYNGPSMVAEIPSADDETLLGYSGTLADSPLEFDLALSSDRLSFEAAAGDYPSDETLLYRAMSDQFAVAGGQIRIDYVAVNLVEGADLAGAREVASTLNQSNAIAVVDINDDDVSDFGTVPDDLVVTTRGVIDAAEALDGVTEANAFGTSVAIRVESIGSIVILDSRLSSTPGYNDITVSFTKDGKSVSRQPGGTFYVDEFTVLARSGLFDEASVSDEKYAMSDDNVVKVSVKALVATDPYELGYLLGRSGVGDIEGAVVDFAVFYDDDRYSGSFPVGDDLGLEGDGWLSAAEAAGIQKGWTAGIR